MSYLVVTDFPQYRVSDSGIVETLWTNRRKGFSRTAWSLGHDWEVIVSTGYRQRVALWDGQVKRLVRVYVLVLETFVGPCPQGYVARHLNDIADDNRLSNLVWGTQAENVHDAGVNRRRDLSLSSGDQHTSSSLRNEEVLCIREKYAAGASRKDLAEEFRVPLYTIRDVVTRKTYTLV